MNETLLYIILGVMYLIFTIIGKLAKKKQQPSKNQDPWSLEDALGDLQGYTEEQPEIAPIPAPYSPTDFSQQPVDLSPAYTDIHRISTTESDPVPTVNLKSVEKPPLETHERNTISKIVDQIKDPKSAQTAIILSEILGKPKAARRFSKLSRRP